MAAALFLAAAAVFALSGLRAGAPPAEVAGASLAFAWLFLPYAAFGTRSVPAALRTWLGTAPGRRGVLLLLLLLAGFAAYAWAATRLDPRAISLPLRGAIVILVFELVVAAVAIVRPVSRIGYTFALTRGDWLAAGAAFAIFAVIAIPLGLAMGFLHPGWARLDALEWARRAFALVFLVSLPEELVFRGLLQNGLERLLPSPRGWRALVIGSLIFGASHLHHPPAPNWRYAILATLAGIAYGWVWHRTGKITAAALVHAAVVLVWALALRGG